MCCLRVLCLCLSDFLYWDKAVWTLHGKCVIMYLYIRVSQLTFRALRNHLILPLERFESKARCHSLFYFASREVEVGLFTCEAGQRYCAGYARILGRGTDGVPG